MGKAKTKAPAAQEPVKAEISADDEMFLVRAHELKEKGNQHFQRREHVQALACYAQALRLAPESHSDRALFHSNRAACYLRDSQYNEVIHECNQALAVAPKFGKALLRRARAFELKGDLQRALTDAKLLSSFAGDIAGEEPVTSEEVKEMMTRIESQLQTPTNKKQRAKARAALQKSTQALPQTPASGGAAGLGGAGLGAQPQRKPVQPLIFRVTLGDEIKTVQVPGTLPFSDLVSVIRKNFPDESASSNLQLKYRDREDQLITITSRQDLLGAVATSISLQAAQQKQAPSGLGGLGLAGKGGAAPPAPPSSGPIVNLELVRGPEAEAPVVFEDWLLDFAELFREHLGIDVDGHVDLHNDGLEKCNLALETNITSEEAAPLFDQAAAKFQEVSALALLNWGNVHMCQARRLFDSAAGADDNKEKKAEDKKDDKPKQVTQETRAKAEEHYFLAEEKYKMALEMKSDFYEAVIASGQQLFERAKLLSCTITADKDKKAMETSIEELFQTAQNKLQEALASIPENAVVGGTAAQAEDGEKKEGAEKPKEEPKKAEAKKESEGEKPKEGAAEGEAPTQPDEVLVRSQVLVMWGNVMYEHSQVRAQQGKDWQELLDGAVAKFREAECSEDDISGALASHAGNKKKLEAEKAKEESKEAPKAAAKEQPKKEEKSKPKSGKGKGKK